MGLSDNWWTVIIVAFTILFALIVRSSSAIACAQAGYSTTMQLEREEAAAPRQEGMQYRHMNSHSL